MYSAAGPTHASLNQSIIHSYELSKLVDVSGKDVIVTKTILTTSESNEDHEICESLTKTVIQFMWEVVFLHFVNILPQIL